MSRAMVIMLVMILLASGLTSGSTPIGQIEAADGPDLGPIPILSLSLFPPQMQAKVTQSQLGAVTFGGNATVDQMRFMSSTVTLNGMVSTGWPLVLSPQTIEFNGPGTMRFQVTVIVPPGTSSLLTGHVRVDGSCKAPLLSPVVAACSGVVSVAPYYRGRITSSESDITIEGGEKKDIDLTVYNDGNSEAQLRIYVLNKPKEIQVSFSETEFQIPQDNYICITVSIKAVPSADSGNYMVDMIVEADTFDGLRVEVTSFNMSVYIPSLKTKLGISGMMTIMFIIGIAVGVVILWKKGIFSWIKWFRWKRSVRE